MPVVEVTLSLVAVASPPHAVVPGEGCEIASSSFTLQGSTFCSVHLVYHQLYLHYIYLHLPELTYPVAGFDDPMTRAKIPASTQSTIKVLGPVH